MITVTEIQQQAVQAELAKRAKRAPAVPQPTAEHVQWAKRVLADGYQAAPLDAADATRILEHAGLDPAEYHSGKQPDSAPPGARAVAGALRAREQDAAESRKAFADRGITEGPGGGREPGHPEPEQFERPYLDAGHGAEAPMSEPARTNPMPSAERGDGPVPVALPRAGVQVQHVNLPGDVRAGLIPPHISASLTLGSPSER